MKVKHTYKGKEIEIEFETTGERTDSPDEQYYYCEFMDGFYNGHKMFQAVGLYEHGSDDLVEITDIEIHCEFKEEERNCAFQYYNGRIVKIDKTDLTLTECKKLWEENYDSIVKNTKDDVNDVEVAIWINMKNNSDYNEKFLHLISPKVDEDGDLWVKKIYTKNI